MPGGVFGRTSGPLAYVPVIASRDLALADIRNPLVNATGSNFVLTIQIIANAGFKVGDVFAVQRTSTGTLTIAAGSGVTVNDPTAQVAAMVANGPPVGFQMVSANVWNAL